MSHRGDSGAMTDAGRAPQNRRSGVESESGRKTAAAVTSRPRQWLAPLSIAARLAPADPQHIENASHNFHELAGRAHREKSRATFACRSLSDRIQPAASGKWGEVPVFDISRIEMTMFYDVTHSASQRKSDLASRSQELLSILGIGIRAIAVHAVGAAGIVRRLQSVSQFSSSLAEANHALVRSAAL